MWADNLSKTFFFLYSLDQLHLLMKVLEVKIVSYPTPKGFQLHMVDCEQFCRHQSISNLFSLYFLRFEIVETLSGHICAEKKLINVVSSIKRRKYKENLIYNYIKGNNSENRDKFHFCFFLSTHQR